MTKEELSRLNSAKLANPTAGRGVLARLTGVSERKVREFMSGGVVSKAEKTVVVEVKKGKSLADFRNTYDKATIVPARVRSALKTLGSSGWEYEMEFCRIAGVKLSDLAAFRDQFADYIVSLRDNRRAWAGSIKTASMMKEMI